MSRKKPIKINTEKDLKKVFLLSLSKNKAIWVSVRYNAKDWRWVYGKQGGKSK